MIGRRSIAASAFAVAAGVVGVGVAGSREPAPPRETTTRSAPATQLDLPAPGRSVAERFAEIRDRVQRVVVYPPIARKREIAGESIVEFAIDADGRAVDVRTLRTSGSPLLDAAAITAVGAAAPLPWVYGRIIVPVRFALNEVR